MRLVLHGHTHASDGVARLGAAQVVNPGSLRYGHGRFALVRMVRDRRAAGGARRWRVGAVELVQLGTDRNGDDGAGIVAGGGGPSRALLAFAAVGALVVFLAAAAAVAKAVHTHVAPAVVAWVLRRNRGGDDAREL